MFSSDLISIIVGLSLLYFGICTAFMGFNMKRDFDNTIPNITIIIGIIAIIFGFLFLFYINALSFMLIMGIIAIALAVFALNQPIFIAIIIGIVLIVEGIAMMLN